MKVHFISIGGSIMHNLAIALKKKGYEVTGSDDEIFEPAKTRLLNHGILPEKTGWFEDKITTGLDAVILGMHAKNDNPELAKALELNIPIKSFPEFMYLHAASKKRVVIAGSHGKTTICSMVMHVLKHAGINFDYMVGSTVEGFTDSVRLSEDAPLMVFEGDEYLSSVLDMNPKFLWYKPHVALISGIAWDHMNVFPTFENYKSQFSRFIDTCEPGCSLFFDGNDVELNDIIQKAEGKNAMPYFKLPYELLENKFVVDNSSGEKIEMAISGSHNMLNMSGAIKICEDLGVSKKDSLQFLKSFTGAGKRLELLCESENVTIFKDFAHAPSKVKATIAGVREQFPGRKIIACLELHTFSSLNRDFLPQYNGTTSEADEVLLYINEEAIKLKRMQTLTSQELTGYFNNPRMKVFFEIKDLTAEISETNLENSVVLMMSSGNFGGIDLKAFSQGLI